MFVFACILLVNEVLTIFLFIMLSLWTTHRVIWYIISVVCVCL